MKIGQDICVYLEQKQRSSFSTLFLSIRRSSVVQSLIISNADWRDVSSYSKPTCKKISFLVPAEQQESVEGQNRYPKCWQGTQVSPWSAISSPHFQERFKSHLHKPNKRRLKEIPVFVTINWHANISFKNNTSGNIVVRWFSQSPIVAMSPGKFGSLPSIKS